jgi:hypothetical protein
MIADFPSPILLRFFGASTGFGGATTLRDRVSMPIYSPKRGFKAPLFVKDPPRRA